MPAREGVGFNHLSSQLGSHSPRVGRDLSKVPLRGLIASAVCSIPLEATRLSRVFGPNEHEHIYCPVSSVLISPLFGGKSLS